MAYLVWDFIPPNNILWLYGVEERSAEVCGAFFALFFNEIILEYTC